MWPDGKQCAVAFTFDLDAESAWAQENAPLMGVNQGTYGAKTGAPLILSVLEKHAIQCTFFIPGVVAEDHPETVSSIVSAGHEIAAHGYTHDSPASLSREEEEDQLVRARGILESFGAKVSGYRAPLGEISENTNELVNSHKLTYSSSMTDGFKPYRHAGMNLIELPSPLTLDDWVSYGPSADFFSKSFLPNSMVHELWGKEFEGIYQLGGLFVLIMHPQITGTPSRLILLDEFIDFVKSHSGTWITTCSQIADQAHLTLPLP
ncbi:MAG: polysaccharide deacetylase family protein [Deltaproteobacteria bacterium]|nr:polysaccharide deacetylase family protein [Deltaproteobacteria bacterium]